MRGSEPPPPPLCSVRMPGVARGHGRGEATLLGSHGALSLSPPCFDFGPLPELFPRAVSSLACRQVWMFCQHSREFMIACRCASKNTLYPEQKLMQA